MSIDINQTAHLLVTALAIFFFISMSYVSVTLFRVEDRGAKRGKQLISVLAGGSALYVSWQLISSAPGSWLISLASAVLFAYAIWIFFAAKAATIAKPLDFAMSVKAPTQFVTHGPYRYIRHPFYSAYCAAWIASLIQLQSWYAAAICAVLISIYIRTALREESAFKKSTFAKEYEIYVERTGMLIPLPILRSLRK